MSETDANANTEAAQSTRGAGDDVVASSGLRSANAGGSSHDATNVSNAGGPSAGVIQSAPTEGADVKSQ